jgi:tetratricopeptide (TPR) repeat protein
MASGRLPFDRDTDGATYGAILHEPAEPPSQSNPHLPPQLEAIIVKALEKDRELRYQHASEMRADLQRLKRDTESGKVPAAISGPVAVAEASAPALGRRTQHDKRKKIVSPALLGSLLNRESAWSDRGRTFLLLSCASAKPAPDREGHHRSRRFRRQHGDAIFDDTLKTALSVSLRQSFFLNLLSENQVSSTLKLMTRPADAKLTLDVARELCQRTGSKAYLTGAIGSLGTEYVLELKAVNCQSGDTLAEEQVTAGSKEKVLDVLGEAASKLRGELGESLATVQKFDVPLEQATTSSLEALQALSLGEKASKEKAATVGLPYYQRAIQLDPNFAYAYHALGNEYFNVGDFAGSSEYFSRAFQLREHASEKERLEITADYYQSVTGEQDKSAATFQEWIENYPLNPVAYANLGIVYASQRRYEKALEVTRQAQHLGPDRVRIYVNLAFYSLALQRLDDARQFIHDWEARSQNKGGFYDIRYALAFLGSDSAAMAEQQKQLAGQHDYDRYVYASDTEAYGGRLGSARELTKRAVDVALPTGQKEKGAILQAIAAQREAAYGYTEEGRQRAAEAFKLAPTGQEPKAKPRLRSPWRAIRHGPSPWHKIWRNAFRWTRRCSRFGCLRFRHNWRWAERIRLSP